MILDLLIQLRPVITDVELIRIGPNHAGGYLIPDSLDNITTCFSATHNAENAHSHPFIYQLCGKYGMGAHLINGINGADLTSWMQIDKSGKTLPIKTASGAIAPLTSKKLNLSNRNSNDSISLDTWVDSLADTDDNNLLLHIDINGKEYTVFESVTESTLNRFKIIVLKLYNLHNCMSNDNLDSGLAIKSMMLAGSSLEEEMLSKLTKTHYLTWLTPDNTKMFAELQFELSEFGPNKVGTLIVPDVVEISLIRKDSATPIKLQTHWPHPLDFPQDLSQPGVPLPNGWPGRLIVKT